MRPPAVLLIICAIPLLLGACSSTPSGSSGTSGGTESGNGDAPASVPNVTGQQIRVEWFNLKPTRNDPPLGLINNSSPELKEMARKPRAYSHIKPLKDQDMSVLLEALKSVDFFEYAKEGGKLSDYELGDGNGVISVAEGEKRWILLFGKNMGNTPIPTVYRDSKGIIIEFHRRTLYLMPTSPQDPDRVFRVPTSRYPGR